MHACHYKGKTISTWHHKNSIVSVNSLLISLYKHLRTIIIKITSYIVWVSWQVAEHPTGCSAVQPTATVQLLSQQRMYQRLNNAFATYWTRQERCKFIQHCMYYLVVLWKQMRLQQMPEWLSESVSAEYRISQFVTQWVPDSRTSISERPSQSWDRQA